MPCWQTTRMMWGTVAREPKREKTASSTFQRRSGVLSSKAGRSRMACLMLNTPTR
jgi:hypothetical protein